MEKRVQYWLEIAEYDLETAQAMLDTGRLLYVGFMCHQVIEKVLKGLHAHVTGEIPPYTHDLRRLARMSGADQIMSEEQRDLIDLLMPLNIAARYPSDKAAAARTLNRDICVQMIRDTKGLYRWIRDQLPST